MNVKLPSTTIRELRPMSLSVSTQSRPTYTIWSCNSSGLLPPDHGSQKNWVVLRSTVTSAKARISSMASVNTSVGPGEYVSTGNDPPRTVDPAE